MNITTHVIHWYTNKIQSFIDASIHWPLKCIFNHVKLDRMYNTIKYEEF